MIIGLGCLLLPYKNHLSMLYLKQLSPKHNVPPEKDSVKVALILNYEKVTCHFKGFWVSTNCQKKDISMKSRYELNPAILALMLVVIVSMMAILSSHADQSNEGITIENAYVPQLPPTSMAHSAYLTITNNSDQVMTITGVNADGFKMSHLHETENSDGVMSMKSMVSLDIDPGETITLKPGGVHIMMMHPLEYLAGSSGVPITLSFANGHFVKFVALVQAVN